MALTIGDLGRQGLEDALRNVRRMSDEEAELLRNNWEFSARPDQLPPPGNWTAWLYLAGRGSGKTRALIEWVRCRIKLGARRIALIGPTAASTRDVLIEGESGILSHAWEFDHDNEGRLMGRPIYEPSKRRLTWQNGAIATAFSAEEPDRLRGPQHDTVVADELAAWPQIKRVEGGDVERSYAWDMAMMGLRLPPNPQAMIATTPRPLP